MWGGMQVAGRPIPAVRTSCRYGAEVGQSSCQSTGSGVAGLLAGVACHLVSMHSLVASLQHGVNFALAHSGTAPGAWRELAWRRPCCPLEGRPAVSVALSLWEAAAAGWQLGCGCACLRSGCKVRSSVVSGADR